MEDKIVYVADVAYKVDFKGRALVRIDEPSQKLAANDLKDRGDYYTTMLYKDTRLPQNELLEWDESKRLSFEVHIPKEIFRPKFWEDFYNEISINEMSLSCKWNIHLGQHHNPAMLAPPTSRDLPVFNVSGTDFLVDVQRMELREKSFPKNTISIKFDMEPTANGYRFSYDRKHRNLPEVRQVIGKAPDINEVIMPELVKLDPKGMADKYGVPLEKVRESSDFELMVDKGMLEQRLKGKMVTIDIAGHNFYVDHMTRKLRPHDDFLSEGIKFDDLGGYVHGDGHHFIIPYNPKTHELEQFPHEITEIPRDLILVEFANPRLLDPVGYNRVHGKDPLDGLQLIGVQDHFVARIVDWKEMYIDRMVERTKNKLDAQGQQKPDSKQEAEVNKRKGHRL